MLTYSVINSCAMLGTLWVSRVSMIATKFLANCSVGISTFRKAEDNIIDCHIQYKHYEVDGC